MITPQVIWCYRRSRAHGRRAHRHATLYNELVPGMHGHQPTRPRLCICSGSHQSRRGSEVFTGEDEQPAHGIGATRGMDGQLLLLHIPPSTHRRQGRRRGRPDPNGQSATTWSAPPPLPPWSRQPTGVSDPTPTVPHDLLRRLLPTGHVLLRR